LARVNAEARRYARDAAEAVALAQAAVADGTRTVVATPHAGFVDPATLRERVAALRLPLEVCPGAEPLVRDRPAALLRHGLPGLRSSAIAAA
jgi:tyrosine-protein phosphatase YwqE